MYVEKPEKRAIRETSAVITDSISSLPDGPPWFATQLKQHAFIARTSILSVQGITDYQKASELLTSVETKISITENPEQEFWKFIEILRSNPSLDGLVDRVLKQYSKCGGIVDSLPPRPIQHKPGVLTMRDLKVLSSKLQDVAWQWNSLGIQLDFTPGILSGIRSAVLGDPADALQRLLTLWLQREDPPATLDALVEAIGGTVIANQVLAKSLRNEKEDFPSLREQEGANSSTQSGTVSTESLSSSSARNAGATSRGENILDESDLLEVSDYLMELGKDDLYHVGLVLGVKRQRILDMMEQQDQASVCDGVITAWLNLEDYVKKQGLPTWSRLMKALRHQRLDKSNIASRISEQIAKDKGITLF